jgi:hypothetical protein
MPRVVRLGRAANDNSRQPGALTRLFVVGLVGAFVALVLANWRFL